MTVAAPSWAAESSVVSLPKSLTHTADLRVQSVEEGLFLRRIANFLLSQELEIAEQQSLDFLDRYPKSEYRDTVLGWLGDIAFVDGRWRSALKNYQKIDSPKLQLMKLPFGMHALFALGEWRSLREIGAGLEWKEAAQLLPSSEPLKFYLAEAYFRRVEDSFGASLTAAARKVASDRAIELYEQLQTGPYALRSLEALAWLYCRKGELALSKARYDRLEELDPHHAKTIGFDPLKTLVDTRCNPLIEAANCAVNFRATTADLDHQILRWLALSFDLGRFEQIVDAAPQLAKSVSPSARALCEFLLGRSYFELGQLALSAPPLERYLAHSAPLSGDARTTVMQQRKNALMCLFQVGAICKRPEVLDGAISVWQQELPSDTELARALFNRANLRAQSNSASALVDFRRIIADFAEAPFCAEAFAGAIALSAQLEQWPTCSDLSVDYCTKFPKDAQLPTLGPIIVEALAQSLRSAPTTAPQKLTAFLTLQENATLSNTLRTQWFLDLAQRLTQLECANISREWMVYLCGGASALTSKEEDPYQHYVAAVLTTAPSYTEEEQRALYLTLFNHCIARVATTPQQIATRDLAAAALTGALKISRGAIAFDNLIWLGDHYYERLLPQPITLPHSPVDVGRIRQPEAYLPTKASATWRDDLAVCGIAAYRAFLCDEEKGWHLSSKELDSALFEQSALRCGRLLFLCERPTEQIELMSNVRARYRDEPQRHWSLRGRALFELALVADLQGAHDLAAPVYVEVIEGIENATPLRDWMTWRMANNALLIKGRKAASLQAPLRALRELQSRRRADCEPLYLEAGLREVAAQSATSSAREALGLEAKGLEGIKMLFAQSRDMSGRAYLDELRAQPEQWERFGHYMIWIDARIAQVQSQLPSKWAAAQGAFSTALFDYLGDKLAGSPLVAARVQADQKRNSKGASAHG